MRRVSVPVGVAVAVFEGVTLQEVLQAHLETEPVPPSVLLHQPVPARLEALLLRCLAKDPAQRPAGARELREALEACHGDVGPWTQDTARAWWERERQRLAVRQEAGGGASEAPTRNRDVDLDLDVAERHLYDAPTAPLR